jgi:hypothetical protein
MMRACPCDLRAACLAPYGTSMQLAAAAIRDESLAAGQPVPIIHIEVGVNVAGAGARLPVNFKGTMALFGRHAPTTQHAGLATTQPALA